MGSLPPGLLTRVLTRVLTVSREVCAAGRVLQLLLCEVESTVRGLCSVVDRIREDFTSLDSAMIR